MSEDVAAHKHRYEQKICGVCGSPLTMRWRPRTTRGMSAGDLGPRVVGPPVPADVRCTNPECEYSRRDASTVWVDPPA
jgi:hypothetical protein